MAVITRWCLSLVLLLSIVVHAQENTPAPPEPLALDANWWSYFEPAERLSEPELKARVAKARARLEQL